MRRAFTSVLLIVALTASMWACLTGSASRQAASRGPACGIGRAAISCTGEKVYTAHVAAQSCRNDLTPPPGKCTMRSFVQLQFAAYSRADFSDPLRRQAGKIAAPPDSVIVISSIGSPETDRGPPLS